MENAHGQQIQRLKNNINYEIQILKLIRFFAVFPSAISNPKKLFKDDFAYFFLDVFYQVF